MPTVFTLDTNFDGLRYNDESLETSLSWCASGVRIDTARWDIVFRIHIPSRSPSIDRFVGDDIDSIGILIGPSIAGGSGQHRWYFH